MCTQRTLAPVQRVLAFLVGLVFVCDLAVVGVHLLDDHTSLISNRTPSARGTSSSDTSETVVPGPGQAFVTGEADRVAADNAQTQPVMSPFTITAVERGVGRLTIDKALVGDRRVTISWDGGTPLPVSGSGGLDVGVTHVEVDDKGPVYSLDGAGRPFLPGTYSLATTVAVGSGGGLSTPQEGVQFTADRQTVLSSRGNVVIRLDPQKVDLLGPGKLAMTGKLRVQFPKRKTNASSVTFAEGPYRVTVDPADGRVRVDAVLQGRVDVH